LTGSIEPWRRRLKKKEDPIGNWGRTFFDACPIYFSGNAIRNRIQGKRGEHNQEKPENALRFS
jgi:hypothetical protein